MNQLKKRLIERTQMPTSSETVPFYYRKMMQWTFRIMFVYTILVILFCLLSGNAKVILWTLPLSVGITVSLFKCNDMPFMFTQILYSLLALGWIFGSIMIFGWRSGTTQQMLPLLVIVFFSIYLNLLQKILILIGLLGFRTLVFILSMQYGVMIELSDSMLTSFSFLNSVVVYVHLALVCYILSSNIQASEKQIIKYAEEQSAKAKTDPLTRLMNRRSMEDLIKKTLAASNTKVYSIGMADIDLFKSVNDNYGHDCGDVVLQELSDLFLRMTNGQAYVSRWGGEEFLFFLPEMNMDEAAVLLTDIHDGVSRKIIRYKDMDLKVTITIGIAEECGEGTLSQAIKEADEKLYIGKHKGRNEVII